MSDEDEIGEKSDLTRIEDLSEFLHQDNADVDAALKDKEEELPSPPSLDELPAIDDLESDELDSEESSFESDDEFTSEETDFSSDETSFDSDESTFGSDDSTFDSEESSFDSDDTETDTDEFSSEETDFSSDETNFESDDSEFKVEETSFDSDDDDDTSDELSESSDEFETEETDFSSDESSFDTEDEADDSEFSSEETSFDSEELSEDEEPEEVQEFEEQPMAEETTTTAPIETAAPLSTPRHIDRSEKFEDVKAFAKNITYGQIATGGNPPFSIILRNVKFEEDAEDILIILSEHGLLDPSSETAMRDSLESGSLLISQISEFAAIYLTHKFRRFQLDIQMGLSDELHPSKSYESDSVGLVSKSRMHQNKNETTRIEKSKVELESILLTTTPTLENFRIIEYLGIVTEFIVINEEELLEDDKLNSIHEREAKGHPDSEIEIDLEAEVTLGHSAIYQDLSEKLRPKCLKKNGNAVVGINYQITPLSSGEKYKISCSGSAVWVIDNN
ncbi:hypothetical protein A9Q84_12905 [Halobacteriovorax marinus]|uniref:Uncharacterized protein n=1 Tax=Halobacteriovorax marinus TaxID=97084 RepID=A0A1Y5FE19_9BACT|nr:hypothetical protein A9Q84_12905 [Halobacteriovorax marinus]